MSSKIITLSLVMLSTLSIVAMPLPVLAAPPSAAVPSAAPDEIELVTGGFVKGEIVEYTPGAYVVIVPVTGEARRISWADISQVVRSGNVDSVAALVERGASVNATDTATQTTPLMWAVRSNNLPAANLLLEHGGTFFGGPDLVLDRLLDEVEARQGAETSLGAVYLGGAMLDPRILERVELRFGIVVMRAYGSSEAPISTAGQRREARDVRLADDGAPLAGVEVRQGSKNDPTECCVTGPHLFLGYVDADGHPDPHPHPNPDPELDGASAWAVGDQPDRERSHREEPAPAKRSPRRRGARGGPHRTGDGRSLVPRGGRNTALLLLRGREVVLGGAVRR